MNQGSINHVITFCDAVYRMIVVSVCGLGDDAVV